MAKGMYFVGALSSLLCFLGPVFCRELYFEHNPGCNSTWCLNSTKLASVRVGTKGTQDCITYLWSSVGSPGIVIARTPEGKDVNVTWSNEADDPEPSTISLARTYSMAVIFTRLLAVNVTTPNYKPGESTIYHAFNLSEQPFYPSKTLEDTDAAAAINMSTHIPSTERSDLANFSVKFSTETGEGRESVLPRLKYTENSTRVEVAFEGWSRVNSTDSFVKEAKNVGLNFILEVLLVPDPNNQSPPGFNLTSGRSLDDEYTPSQFWHNTIKSGDGFLYWKPIVYTSMNSRNIANSVPLDTVKNSTASKPAFFSYREMSGSDKLPPSIASLLYKDSATAAVDNAVFLYLGFNATTDTAQVWNAVIGVGTPPSDEISLTVILIIALGLGLPGVVLVFGVPGGTIYKRCRGRTRSGYKPIQ